MLELDLNKSQFEVNRLNGELRSLTEQLNRKNAEIEKFNCIVNNMKIENEELLKENTRNNEQVRTGWFEVCGEANQLSRICSTRRRTRCRK